ncbi:MAG: TonB-dependent receptor [Kordiimonadaceae bacterium]|nr:TonB-dependent receptor [Kordiimonadaceae bacterium]MBO6568971.1 TonB-dependent receptor [Kordiimonadaceae bacterium]MBO6965054.1 TonB-dependent receptor [Kordiimonadaceae bacterium]
MVQELKKFRRAALMGSAATLVASFALGTGAYAQDAAADEEESIEEVVVTGSRIIRRDINAPSPVVVIGAVDIRDSGETDVSKLLREIPALNGSLTATGSTQTGFASDLNDDVGVGRLNLRNLGTNRTLVLVNNRRHVSAIQGSADVNVSTIPVALIENVETTTGGGSAVYGADAVSGVVNFILKDDFEGLDYRAQYSLSDEGDADNVFVALTGGVNFDDDRGNAVLSVEYTRQSRINRNDRPNAFGEGFFDLIANSPELTAALGRDGNADNVFVPDFRINFSSADGIIALYDAAVGGSVFGGIVGLGGEGSIPGVPAVQVFNNGTLRAFDFGVISNPFESSGGDGIQAANPNAAIVPYIDRINVNGLFRYELTDGIEMYAETKYVREQTGDADGIPFNDDIPIALDNAFIPTALRAQIDAAIASGITPEITLSRDILDREVIGRFNTDRQTLRLVGGFRGEFENGWRWDLSYNYGRTDIDTVNRNSRVEDRFFAGVDAVVDPTTGNIVCRSDIDPTALPPGSPFPSNRPGFLTFDPGDGQCIPINLFGRDSITAESGAFAFIDTLENAEIEQRQFLATLAGDSTDFFELPAGPVDFAIGYEYRQEKSSFIPPELERAGLLYNTVGEARDIVSGTYDVNEVFGEVSIPILEGVEFFESVRLDGSFRYTDHSTAGSIETYGTALQWQVDSNVRFRAAYNRAVRAPNIFELFSPAQPAFIGVTQDPCAPQNINAGTDNRATNCAQFVDPGFDPADFLSARVAGSTGGNPNLSEETADTYTIGVVLTPEFIPGLTITADYYNIEIEDAIDALSGREIAELCVDLPDINNPFCGQVTRDPNNGNAISDFESGNVNLGAFSTEGIDFLVNYQADLADWFDGDYGTFDQTITATHVFNNIEFPDPLDPTFGLDDNGQSALPEWILNYQARWTYGDFSLTWQTRYQSSQLNIGINNEDVADNPTFADPLKTGDAFVHDVSATYQVNDYANITFGINNLSDRKPFIGSLVRPVDPIGRTFFLTIGGNF